MHLSTCVVLMFAASGLIYGGIQYFNVITWIYRDEEHGLDLTPYAIPIYISLFAILSILLLGTTAFLCESYVHRRQRRQQEPQT